MSNHDPVVMLLAKLATSSDVISSAYYQGRIHKSDENARDIERLRQLRLLSPDIRDAFQLRASFRHFLNAALNTDRLFSMGANIGGHFQHLATLVEGHSIAFQEGRDADCERYEVEIRESISDIADAIDDELIILQAQVATRFAAVSTIAEKKRQNLHYQQRTQGLVNLLESFHFSDIGEQLEGHEELALSFRALLADRIPAFRESLRSTLELLNQYLFEFRKIEERAKRVRAFALHLNRNPDWEPKAWDEVTDPEDWLKCATPLSIQSSPNVSAPEAEEMLAEIARTIPATAGTRNKSARPAGQIEDASGNTVVETPESPIRRAVRIYFKEAGKSVQGISARDWWASNPIIIGGIKEEIWMLRVLSEHDNKGKAGKWSLRLEAKQHPVFDGNILVKDVIASKKAA
ncbi:MAG: hypothetical protein WAW10_04525 [Gallionella sp.]